MIKWSRLKAAPFLWRLTRARMGAITEKYDEAREKLKTAQAPEEYVALRDAYDAWLASMAYAQKVTLEGLEQNPPVEMSRLISGLRTMSWYERPKDADQCYAARYIDYLEAAVVLADGQIRAAIANELKEAAADPFWKKVLVAK
jgi:hypothetical protein